MSEIDTSTAAVKRYNIRVVGSLTSPYTEAVEASDGAWVEHGEYSRVAADRDAKAAQLAEAEARVREAFRAGFCACPAQGEGEAFRWGFDGNLPAGDREPEAYAAWKDLAEAVPARRRASES